MPAPLTFDVDCETSSALAPRTTTVYLGVRGGFGRCLQLVAISRRLRIDRLARDGLVVALRALLAGTKRVSEEDYGISPGTVDDGVR